MKRGLGEWRSVGHVFISISPTVSLFVVIRERLDRARERLIPFLFRINHLKLGGKFHKILFFLFIFSNN